MRWGKNKVLQDNLFYFMDVKWMLSYKFKI